jgi:flagellar biosynthesis protein FlhB
MAEETDLSRTEPASPRRLQQARSAGDVPRSAELAAWVVILSALGMLGWLSPRLLNALQALIEAAFMHAAEPFSPAVLEATQTALWAVLPVLVAIFVAALVAPMLLSGWVYAPRLTRADLARIHPFKPLARLFSVDSWFDGTLALLKLGLAAGMVGWTLESGWPALQTLAGSEVDAALKATAVWIGQGMLALAGALVLAAALDAGWRWWRYLRRHAMTWQEVLAEAREAEVHPEVRAQLRGRQQQAGQGSPLPNPPPGGEHPEGHKGANVRHTAINEVIG